MGITQYIYIAVAMLLLSMATGLYFLKKENSQLLEQQGVYKAQLQELAGTMKAKDDIIALCDERTKQLRAEADQRASDAEKARIAARDASKKNRELADELLGFKRQQGETSCAASERLFNEYLDKRGLQ